MKAQRTLLLALGLFLLLAMTGCGIASVSTEGGELTIDVSISEEQVNGIISRVLSAGGESKDFLFTETTSVDLLEPNIIRVFGKTAEGTEGSYDLTMSAVDNALKIEVVSVDVPGVTLDDPRVSAANDELAKAFLDNAQSGDPGGVSNVAVANNELRLTIKAPLNNQ